MSESLSSKPVPLAAVVYVVRFDPMGRPLREAAFHIEMSGMTHVDGCASGALEPLLAATRCSMRETVGKDMMAVFEEQNAQELTAPIDSRPTTETGSLLPAAVEVF